jgi:Alcohol dehydrogenase GroES-like domain
VHALALSLTFVKDLPAARARGFGMALMRAMVLERLRTPLVMQERPLPQPAAGEVLIEVLACGVCRTDLHVVDGELPHPKLPIVPGHEIVGRVAALGSDVKDLILGARVGVPWLAAACGVCAYCRSGRENLCDTPSFTGYTRDGGYATHTLASAGFCYELNDSGDAAETAPLLCAGLIGWRSYRMGGRGRHSDSTGSAPPLTSWPRSSSGKEETFTPSPGPATSPRRILPAGLAPFGRAALTRRRHRLWMLRSFLRLSGR